MVSGLVGSTRSAPNPFHHLDDLSKSHSQAVGAEWKKRTKVTQPGHSELPFATAISLPFRQTPLWWPPLTRRRGWHIQDVQDVPNHPYNRYDPTQGVTGICGTVRGQHSPLDPYTEPLYPFLHFHPTLSRKGPHPPQPFSCTPGFFYIFFFSSLQGAEFPRRKMQSPKGTTSSNQAGSAKEGVLFLPEGVL